MQFIQTDTAPRAVGPYSQAVRVGNLLFISGQIPIAPNTNELALFDGDIARQTDLVLKNIKAILTSEGLDLNSVVKTGVFLSDMNDFVKMNEVYTEHFCEHRPARACVEVARLPKDVGIEIDVIAAYK